MSTQRSPARLVPPGQILRRELEARGWQQKDLAAIIGRPEQAISEIINDKKQITPETARELASAFATSVDFWINLETLYRLRLAERQREERAIQRRAALYAKVPYREMIKRGWIEEHDALEDQESEVCRFLGIASLDEEPRLALAARHSAHGEPERAAELAWARRVQLLAQAQACIPYSTDALVADLQNILAESQAESGVAGVPSRLLALGVHFIIVPHLPQTYLDGAAFQADGNPLVALTLRYDRLDNFWFTLMHEIAHVVLGHPGAHLDRLVGDRVMSDEEVEADQQAADWLIPPDAYRRFSSRTRIGYSAIEQFAAEQHRQPGIIAGRLQHDDPTRFNRYSKYRVKVSPYLAPWIDSAGTG